MSADRENHDMTQTDIAFLLADAADEVEIGIAPVEAVIRGGRRRRARRWAVATATVLVLAGSTGATLAVTGLPGHADRNSTVTTRPSTPEARHVYVPQVTEVAHGTDHGTNWRVVVSVWGPPRDKTEVAGQLAAMRKYGIESGVLPDGRQLVGRTSHYSGLYYGDGPLRSLIFGTDKKWDALSRGELMSGAVPLAKRNSDGPDRLVVGAVATTTRQVTCDWKDGTSSLVAPRPVAGSPVNWFVCTAPDRTGYLSAEVTQ